MPTPTCSGGQITQLQVNNVDCSCVSISTIAWNTAGTQFTITLSNGQSITSPVLTGSTGPAPTVSFRVVGTALQYSVDAGANWTAIYDFSALAGGGVLANQFPALATLTTNFESLLVGRTPYVLPLNTLNTDGDELSGFAQFSTAAPTSSYLQRIRMTFNSVDMLGILDYPSFFASNVYMIRLGFSIVRVSNTTIKYQFITTYYGAEAAPSRSRAVLSQGEIDLVSQGSLTLDATAYNIDVQAQSNVIGNITCDAFSLKYIHQI